MPDEEDRVMGGLSRLLTPALRSIKPPHLKFLVFLAAVTAFFFVISCERRLAAVISFSVTIAVIAFLGCGLEMYQRRLAAEEKMIDAFKAALRNEVRKTRARTKAADRT